MRLQWLRWLRPRSHGWLFRSLLVSLGGRKLLGLHERADPIQTMSQLSHQIQVVNASQAFAVNSRRMYRLTVGAGIALMMSVLSTALQTRLAAFQSFSAFIKVD